MSDRLALLRTIVSCTVAVCGLLLAGARPAMADATVFAGTIATGTQRRVVGGAFGFFPRATGGVTGFEVEVMRTLGEAARGHYDLDGGGASLIVQWNALSRRVKFFGLGGGGVYSGTIGENDQFGGVFAGHAGGGVKVAIAGPLNVRLDYRVYFLSSTIESPARDIDMRPRRLAAGLALAF
jgi:hypothetical protein